MDFKRILKESIKNVLSEAGGSSQYSSLINDAINSMSRTIITYPDKKGNMVKRDCFIYSYGRNHKGNELIRIFQIGSGGSGGMIWKTFSVDKITDLKLQKRFKIRQLPSSVPSFRTDGDDNIPYIYNMIDSDKITGISSNKNPQQVVNKNNSVDPTNEPENNDKGIPNM